MSIWQVRKRRGVYPRLDTGHRLADVPPSPLTYKLSSVRGQKSPSQRKTELKGAREISKLTAHRPGGGECRAEARALAPHL